jgi:hypothetical protein
MRRYLMFYFSSTSLLWTHCYFRYLGSSSTGVKSRGPLGSGAEVKNEWSYTTLPRYTLMVWKGTTLRLLRQV